MKNSRVILRRQRQRRESEILDRVIPSLDHLASQATEADTWERLMGFEGAGAAQYFSAFGECLTNSEFVFTARTRRPPGNPVNAMLSFGYQVLWNHLLAMIELLDQELQQVVRDATLGKRLVDKLVKIYRHGGEEGWVLVHIEVQSQQESNFGERMFVYNYRIYDRYKQSVASLAVLGDEHADWRPQQFGYQLFGCRVNFQFPVIKLLDYQQRLSELSVSCNPFAIVVMAHLAAVQTRNDRLQRKQSKLALVRQLYSQGFEREDVLNLLAFVDWLLTLPQDLEREFRQEVEQLEAEQRMRYVTSFERFGIRQGLLEAIELGLELKFGTSALSLMPEVSQIYDIEQLRTMKEGIKTVQTVEELRQIYQPKTTE